MINDFNDDLISGFLLNKLSEEEKIQFSQKMQEKTFREEVQLRIALLKAVEKSDSDEFAEITDKAIANLRKKNRQRKRTITLYSILSLAAAVLLFIFIVIPLSKNDTKRYIAMAGEPLPVSIENIRTFRDPNQRKESSSIFQTCSVLQISSVHDQALDLQYFFKDCIIYTNFKTDVPVSILVDFDAQLNNVYYLCKDKSVYQLSTWHDIKENELYPLIPVSNPHILNLCY